MMMWTVCDRASSPSMDVKKRCPDDDDDDDDNDEDDGEANGHDDGRDVGVRRDHHDCLCCGVIVFAISYR